MVPSGLYARLCHAFSSLLTYSEGSLWTKFADTNEYDADGWIISSAGEVMKSRG